MAIYNDRQVSRTHDSQHLKARLFAVSSELCTAAHEQSERDQRHHSCSKRKRGPLRCSDNDQQIGGSEGALFLRRSGLTNEQLREVWKLASGGVSKQKLERDDWLVACKLVAGVQHKGSEPNVMSVVGTMEMLPVADFHYDVDPGE